MKKLFSLLALSTLAAVLGMAPARADTLPEISPSLKKMLAGLPIAGLKDDVQGLVASLKKTSCGGGLNGCYATRSGALQLYFFTSGSAQQTFLLVLNQSMALPTLLKPNVQTVFGKTTVRDPIISISTTDYVLTTANMPADLRQVVTNSYFNVGSLAFASGVQLAARANLGGAVAATMKALGVGIDQMTLRAGVVMPIPTDLAAGAGAGAGLADALRHGDTMKKAGADALKIDAFVELQPAPGSVIKMGLPAMTLTDSTFFIDNKLVFGYKGNARFDGSDKNNLLHFQTPLSPEGAMDLLDFSFRMATPQTSSLADVAYTALGMAIPAAGVAQSAGSAALDKLGGGYIGNIKAIVGPLKSMIKPLSVFQVRNPNPPAVYQFGNPNLPFPSTDAPFNMILLGPLADGGPFLYYASETRILGQNMGRMEISVGKAGFQGTVQESISVKLGPLGQTKIKMLANANISASKQDVSLVGNIAGQQLSLILAGDKLSVYLSASCINPFEIRTSATIQESLDIAQIFEGQGGVNVDPASLGGCIGKDLEAALNKIANEYKNLSGYSASQANAALNKIANDAAAAAAAAAKETQRLADEQAAQAKAAYDASYKAAKDAARDLASKSTSAATNALKDAGNAISGAFGGKKKHSDANDKFDRTIFNWDYYYDTRGMKWGNTDLVQYWADQGFAAGERASLEFDLKYYRAQHPNVSDKNLLNTWLGDGIDRCEQSSPDFSLAALVQRNPGGSCRRNLDWWYEQGGMNSGLNARP